jgi:hypothetical protein
MQFNHITPMEDGLAMNSFGNSTCMACEEWQANYDDQQAFAGFDAQRAQAKKKANPQQSRRDPLGILRDLPLRSDALTTNDRVLHEMFLLWEKSGYGNFPTERSMWIVKSGENISFIPWPWSAESGREVWKGPIPKGAVAIAHTHPQNRSPKPSGDPGDQGTANRTNVPVYVVTRNAIWKAVPRAMEPVRVASDGWWQRFEKERKSQQ